MHVKISIFYFRKIQVICRTAQNVFKLVNSGKVEKVWTNHKGSLKLSSRKYFSGARKAPERSALT